MFRKFTFSFFMAAGINLLIVAAPDSVSIDTVDNYSSWGWNDILVIRNNYITLGIVPAIGGRVLQYDLGVDTFMIINESLMGDIFTLPSPTPWDATWGYGGYKTWPAPQSEWNWPPPPVLDWGSYDYEVFQTSGDSVVVWLKGQTETIRTPGLRFDRYLTVYKNSTRVKVSTVLFNENSSAQEWGVWDVTQAIVRHKPLNDYSNISVYFPVTGHDDIWNNGNDLPDRQEILPGIEQVHYGATEGKIFAAVPEGWVCFVDERDNQTYAKVFDIVEGAAYPDNGGIVQVYTNGSSRYMEIEVTGPVENIGANGDSIIFTEYWYAGQSRGPYYSLNHAGAVKDPLHFSRSSKLITGGYAAFSEGQFKIAYLNESEEFISYGPVQAVAPNVFVDLELSANPPAGTRFIELQAFNVDGGLIGTLDRFEYTEDDSFTAKKASATPVIDGIGDEACWDSAVWYPLEYVWLPYNDIIAPEDFTGRFKISWTDDRLLFLVEATDDSLYDGHPAPLQNYWDDDCVEIFIDEDHSGGNHLNSFNAFAYHVSLTYDVVDNNLTGTALFNDHIEAFRTKQGHNYTWELAMKVFDDTYVENGSSVPVTLTDGKELGFSLAYCDNDGSISRENFIGSKYLAESVSNNSYIDASIFGTLSLVGPEGPISSQDIVDRADDQLIDFYPIPADELIFYSFRKKNDFNCTLNIRNLGGQVVFSTILPAGEIAGSLNITELEGGLYTVEIQENNDVSVSRVVIL
jgi:hypothetical protein